MRTLILGLGNPILTDDAVGLRAARLLHARLPHEDIELAEASVGGLGILELLAGFDRVVIIDALYTGDADIASVVRLTVDDLHTTSHLIASHDVAFPQALELGQIMGMELPEHVSIYGIRVKDPFTFREGLTPELETALPAIVQEIERQEFPSDRPGPTHD